MKDPRTANDAAFLDALARLGFPASEDERHDLRRMASDLLEQAAELRVFLAEARARAPFCDADADGARPS